jgi:FtsH-binding integral membrane protein
MQNFRRLTIAAWIWLSLFWSASAWAATTTFASDISKIPPAAVAVALGLSLIGGAAATLRKIASPDIVITKLPWVVASDMLMAVLAGLVTYSVIAWQEFPLLLQPGCITIAAFGGSRVLDRYLGAGLARIDRLAGKPDTEGVPP